MNIYSGVINNYEYNIRKLCCKSNISFYLKNNEINIFITGDFVTIPTINSLYDKVINIDKVITKKDKQKVTLDFSLLYTCGKSEMLFAHLFKIIKTHLVNHKEYEIIWRYQNDSTDILELGQVLQEITELDFCFLDDKNRLEIFRNYLQ